jgi:hypothetical protein
MIYRGYIIERIDGHYVARPKGNEEAPFEIFSTQMRRVIEAINALWLTLSQVRSFAFDAASLVAPRWVRDWLKGETDSIDLDAAYRCGAC